MKPWIVLSVVLIATTVGAQEAPQDREARILKRVTEALDKEVRGLSESLRDLVRGELGVKAPVAPAGSVDKALALVTEELMRKHAMYLASDELEGRNAGYPGNDKAAEYIVDIMKKSGLKPAGATEAGAVTYTQPFNIGRFKTRNCLGYIEGTDPDLKKEVIVLGAHYDHVGTTDQEDRGRYPARGEDKIYNGADDNGSGTTTVLTLIRAFGEGGLTTRRTILFMLFSGEEAGLLGSEHYVNHPTIFPLRQHTFMLNLDMVGRNPEKPLTIEGVGSAEGGKVRAAVEAAVKKTGLNAKLHDTVEFQGGDSDHTSFKKKGIPFTFFFAGLHADYHRPGDHPEKLAYPNMLKVAHTAAHVLLALGNADDSLKFKKLEFGDPPRPAAKRTLGITPYERIAAEEFTALALGRDEGAIKIEKVGADSVAEKAGIKVDDFLLSVAGSRLGRKSPLDDLRAALSGVTAGEDVEIVVHRDGKKVTLKASWEK